MDPGLDFAQALLDQLRRDLKRFAPGRAVELERALGRGPRYLRRVAAKNLRLDEAFAAIRFLGFLPTEYLGRLARSKEWIPPGIPGFFRRRRPAGPTQNVLRELDGFVSWGRTVLIDDPAPIYRFDIKAQLEPLGVDVDALDILNEADSLFTIFARHRPEILGLDAARGLSRSLVTISNALLSQGHLTECCETLDLGFRLECRLDDLKTRHALFRTGARLSRELGFHFDALWCCKEAVFLGLLVPDLKAVTEDRKWLGTLKEVDTMDSTADFLAAGKNDSVAVLAAVESDRAISGRSAADLDRELGAKNAFSGARNRGEPITVARWGKLLEALSISPAPSIRRGSLQSVPVRTGGFLQGLKEPGGRRSMYPFQRQLLTWAEAVPLADSAAEISFPDIPIAEPPAEVFPQIIQAIDDIASRLPNRLNHRQAGLIGRELVRAAYVLRTQGHRNDAADFLDAAFYLQDRLDPGPLLPLANRNAGYLAIELGCLREGLNFALRGVHYGAACRDYREVERSMYVAGVASMVMAEYEVALVFHRACWAFPADQKTLDPNVLCQTLAVSHIRSGNLSEAEDWISRVQPSGDWPRSRQSEFLALQAELLSRSGHERRPLELLGRAEKLIEYQSEPIAKALLLLQKCNHLLDHNRSFEALREAKKFLTLANRIQNNPRGQRALLELCRSFSRSESKAIQPRIEHAQHCLKWPNFDRELLYLNK